MGTELVFRTMSAHVTLVFSVEFPASVCRPSAPKFSLPTSATPVVVVHSNKPCSSRPVDPFDPSDYMDQHSGTTIAPTRAYIATQYLRVPSATPVVVVPSQEPCSSRPVDPLDPSDHLDQHSGTTIAPTRAYIATQDLRVLSATRYPSSSSTQQQTLQQSPSGPIGPI